MALFIDIKIPLSLFLLRKKPQKKKLCKKKKGVFCAQAARLPLLKKRSKTICGCCANNLLTPR